MLRLAPALVAVVVCVAAFYLAWGIPAWTVAKFSIPALFYFSNWVRAFELWGLGALGHTWTLAIEEQFYILWPLVLLIATRILKTEKIVWLCLALAVAVIAHRLNMLEGGASRMRLQNGFDTRADTILIGAALGAFASHRFISFAWLPYAAAAGAALLLFVLVQGPDVYYRFGTTGTALATACIIASALAGGKDPINLILRNRFLVYSGKISYGLYLWHFPITGLFWMAVGVKGVAPLAVQAVDLFLLLPLTYVVCTASYQWIESPALRLKQRFVARQRQSEPLSPSH